MLLAQAAALILGARIGLYVEDHVGVAAQRADRVTQEVQAALGRLSGAAIAVEPPFRCDSEDRCVGEIRTRTRADEVVMLRMFAGPTRIRLLAERVAIAGRTAVSAEAELKQDEETWKSALDAVAATLFPESAAKSGTVIVSPTSLEPHKRDYVPLIAACSSAALLVAGGVFVARRSSDQSALPSGAVVPTDYWNNHSQLETDTSLAVGFLAAGAAALVVGVVWALTD
jgi:hypothetical protein